MLWCIAIDAFGDTLQVSDVPTSKMLSSTYVHIKSLEACRALLPRPSGARTKQVAERAGPGQGGEPARASAAPARVPGG